LSKAQRQSRIVQELRTTSHLRIADLAERFDVSTETIRRDLEELSQEGLVSRAYGGALSRRAMAVQPAFGEREQANVNERWRIGELVASLIAPGEVLMVDSGATTTQFARSLAAQQKASTVLTNSLSIALALGESEDARVILCPGDFSPGEHGVYGPDTLDFLRRFRANKAILGASAIDVDGVMDVNSAAAWVKRTMMEKADETLLLVDSSKFGQRRLEIVSHLNTVDALITDAEPGPELMNALAESGTRVLVADPDAIAATAPEPRKARQ
jgi:DeoR/GlpR family transcriptional regulator of sugar metabolism